jgi:predicted ArsR family transcriptional regulator
MGPAGADSTFLVSGLTSFALGPVVYLKFRLTIDIPTETLLSQVRVFVRLRAMTPSLTERQLAEIAVLADPVRRRLYLYVVGQSGEVSREAAARAVGISRPAAAFHLEKLVEEGLLEAGYRRLSGRRGPGAGRPARVYRRAARELHIDLPSRDYELVARFLLRGVDPEHPGKALKRADQAAWEFGVALGAEARRRARRHLSGDRLHRALTEVLEERGYDPTSTEGGVLRLRNCPFDALSADYRDLVCPMNLSMMRGVLEGMGASELDAVLEPQPGMCCVAFMPTTEGRATE